MNVVRNCFSIALSARKIEKMMLAHRAQTQSRNKSKTNLSFAWQTSIGRSVQARGAKGFDVNHNIYPNLSVYMPTNMLTTLTTSRRQLYREARKLIHLVDPEYAANDDWVVQFSFMTDSTIHYVRRHVDKMDLTYQYALQLGSEMTGGVLRTWSSPTSYLDTNYYHRIVRFDGRYPHEVVGAFNGERATVIYYKVYDRHMFAPAPHLAGVHEVVDLRPLLRHGDSKATVFVDELPTPLPLQLKFDEFVKPCHVLAISGASGVGKSTIMALVIRKLEEAYSSQAPWKRGGLQGTLYDNTILVIGTHYNTNHPTPGTDRLPPTVAPELLHLLQHPPASLRTILFEGNGMKSLTKSIVQEITRRDGNIFILDVSAEVLKARQHARDVETKRVRSTTWLKGDATRAKNVAMHVPVCTMMVNNVKADSYKCCDEIMIAIHTWYGLCGRVKSDGPLCAKRGAVYSRDISIGQLVSGPGLFYSSVLDNGRFNAPPLGATLATIDEVPVTLRIHQLLGIHQAKITIAKAAGFCGWFAAACSLGLTVHAVRLMITNAYDNHELQLVLWEKCGKHETALSSFSRGELSRYATSYSRRQPLDLPLAPDYLATRHTHQITSRLNGFDQWRNILRRRGRRLLHQSSLTDYSRPLRCHSADWFCEYDFLAMTWETRKRVIVLHRFDQGRSVMYTRFHNSVVTGFFNWDEDKITADDICFSWSGDHYNSVQVPL